MNFYFKSLISISLVIKVVHVQRIYITLCGLGNPSYCRLGCRRCLICWLESCYCRLCICRLSCWYCCVFITVLSLIRWDVCACGWHFHVAVWYWTYVDWVDAGISARWWYVRTMIRSEMVTVIILAKESSDQEKES